MPCMVTLLNKLVVLKEKSIPLGAVVDRTGGDKGCIVPNRPSGFFVRKVFLF